SGTLTPSPTDRRMEAVMPHAHFDSDARALPVRPVRESRIKAPWSLFVVSGYEPLSRGLAAVLAELPSILSVGLAPDIATWRQDPAGSGADILILDVDTVGDEATALLRALASGDAPRRLVLLHDDRDRWPELVPALLSSEAIEGLAVLPKGGTTEHL